MTKEEAIAYGKRVIDLGLNDETHAFCELALNVLLEQESILDKIRAKIEGLDGRYVIGDYGIYGENCPKYVNVGEVLSILDKCWAESDGVE